VAQLSKPASSRIRALIREPRRWQRLEAEAADIVALA